MFLISSAKVCIEVIAGRRNNGFHFSPEGENGVQNAIGPSGVKSGSLFVTDKWWYPPFNCSFHRNHIYETNNFDFFKNTVRPCVWVFPRFGPLHNSSGYSQ